jgi:MFS family permease
VSAARRVASAFHSGPLAVRNFRLLTGGQFTSTIGDYCYAVALPWLVLSTHGSSVLLGTVLACYGVPRMVLIPVGGVLAYKVGARTVMLAADAVRCVLAAVPALAVTPYLGGAAGAAAAILYGLTQREFREFGAADESVGDADAPAEVARTRAVG